MILFHIIHYYGLFSIKKYTKNEVMNLFVFKKHKWWQRYSMYQISDLLGSLPWCMVYGSSSILVYYHTVFNYVILVFNKILNVPCHIANFNFFLK